MLILSPRNLRRFCSKNIKVISLAFIALLLAVLTVTSYATNNPMSLPAPDVVLSEIVTDVTPKLETVIIVPEPITVMETKAQQKVLTTEEKTVAEKTTKQTQVVDLDVVINSKNNTSENADNIKSLSGFKDSGLPISELTPPEDLKLDKNGIPTDYKYCTEAKATAYHGDSATASGRKPMPGHIAVNPKEYPYGTELYIVSADGDYVYGYCVAADTGGFVSMGNTDVDVYMDNTDMCYDWGNRDVIIYVL